MFQSFKDKADGTKGPARLTALREEIARNDLSGFIIPRADAHQGEDVAPCDERLSWLTGFTGSAGFAVVLPDIAGVFIDGRYTLQVRDQIDLDAFTPVSWPKNKLGPWIADNIGDGQRIGFDPWLHSRAEIREAQQALPEGALVPVPNLVDNIWSDRPARPAEPAFAYPDELAGKTSAQKRDEIAQALALEGQSSAVLTSPDSIAWLLNIRGSDIKRTPIVQAFAIIHADGSVAIFSDPNKFSELDLDIQIRDWSAFEPALAALDGVVRVDPKSAPYAVWDVLEQAGVDSQEGNDPCILPKACKNTAEIDATSAAHLRDAAAMVEFLCWLDREGPTGKLTEIDVVKALEGHRRATNALKEISFETICGSGPNGAIVHYRVTEATNRPISAGELLLVDSGGQYLDGTTDITRTMAIGTVGDEEKRAFTLVLKGMIAISIARWPSGLAGRDLDALARNALWAQGLDYDHGTGHGVGAYLSVHEGPQRISRMGLEPFLPGMILSNEPGYYKTGKFGIRIENLCVVVPAPPISGADDRDMLAFETLTWVPIDRNLIDASLLSDIEKDWLNVYHHEIAQKLDGRLTDPAQAWLQRATQPI